MRRLVVGMSGASGAIYGIRTLEVLRAEEEIEVHLVMSPSAGRTIHDETDWKVSGPDGAAAILGVPASTLRSKMKRLGIRRHEA